MSMKMVIDTEVRHNVALLRSKAESLKAQADALDLPALATAYRRRASELELQAHLLEAASIDVVEG